MLASVTAAPVTTILPGGCYQPLPHPTEPKPWERNCWDPTKWGTDIQLPSPDAEVQAVEGMTLLG